MDKEKTLNKLINDNILIENKEEICLSPTFRKVILKNLKHTNVEQDTSIKVGQIVMWSLFSKYNTIERKELGHMLELTLPFVLSKRMLKNGQSKTKEWT